MPNDPSPVTILALGSSRNDALAQLVRAVATELGKRTPLFLTECSAQGMSDIMAKLEAGMIANILAFPAGFGPLSWAANDYTRQQFAEFLTRKGVRYVATDMDHPAYSERLIANLPENAVYTNLSTGALGFAKELAVVEIPMHTWAHGADETTPLPWDRRDIDILFAGNLNANPDQILKGWYRLPLNAMQTLFAMKEVYESRSRNAPIQPDQLARQCSGDWVPTAREVASLVREFDQWARQRARYALLTETEGLTITFLGSGWDQHPGTGRNFLGLVNAGEVAGFVRRARIVVNLHADYFQSHERVFAGMAARTAVASSGHDILSGAESWLGQDTGAPDPFISLSLWNSGDALRDALADDAHCEAIANQGYQRFLKAHSWAHRAEQLATYLQSEPVI